MALRTISVCAGIGALDVAFHRAFPESRTVLYVEREIYPARVLAARMEDQLLDAAPVWSDLTTLDARAWCGAVDCLVGGIPCQPFSVAGKRQGTDDERWIWSDVLRIIREADIRIVGLENVPGFVRHGLPTVLEDLAALGFDAAWRVVSAADVGAPHIRKRVFLLAYRESDPAWTERRSEGREIAGRIGPYLADARHGLVPLAGRGPQGRAGAGPAGEDVGHAHVLDDHRSWHVGSGWGRELADPGFPPAPDDRAGWAEVLRERPDLAPATQPGLHRLADESGPRLDRLRAAGNAVVVRQAAAAYAKLRDDIGI